jgi:hypothetical protein
LDSNYSDAHLLLEGGAGYYFNKKYFLTLGYSYNFLKSKYIEISYMSINYQFDNFLKPFVGVIVGKSTFGVYNHPITNFKMQQEEYTTENTSYGIQAGIEFNLEYLDKAYNQYGLTLTLQHFKHDLSVIAEGIEVTVNGQTNMMIGLKYIF